MKRRGIIPRYKYVGLRMIFDIKLYEKITNTSRLVRNGHKTKAPSGHTYLSVVSRKRVWLAFTHAYLNDLDICAYEIGNAYVNAIFKEKLWTTAGIEFGRKKGSVIVTITALYGLKLIE